MTAERWHLVKAILAGALDRPAAERPAFLERACGGDASLRDELERLLVADAAPDVIALPTARAMDSVETAVSAADLPEGIRAGDHPADLITMAGRRIGAFTITRLIGVGGMGTVYEARQDYPSRTVALKLLRWGRASKGLLKRFRFEAEVLARLQHPGIAQLFEAGVQSFDGQGLPYFAMELVPDAQAIDQYAAESRMSIRDRVALFAHVCEAVQHGHIRGVIHRDLKPSNILVCRTESGARPKVIDFGVARLTDSDVALTTMVADGRQLVGTLQYMSPEQCSGGAGDVDVRSDVYSLGVVLYELVTGKPPYDLGSSHALEVPSIIRERQPLRPSAVAAGVRGDLEIILLRALEKDRERRYQSARDLAEDLERYLAGDAILARAPSAIYEARKFVRRNRALVVSAGAIMLVLLGGVGVSLKMYQKAIVARDAAQRSEQEVERQVLVARGEADRAKRVAAFLSACFESLDTTTARNAPDAPGWDPTIYPALAKLYRPHRTAGKVGTDATALDVLTSAATQIDSEFADDPLVYADLAQALARAIRAAGGPVELYRGLYAKSLDARRRVQGVAHPDTIQELFEQADNFTSFNEWARAEPVIREAMSACPSVFGPLSAQERELSRLLAMALTTDLEQYGRAAAWQQAMFERCARELGPDVPATLVEEAVLGMTLGLTSDWDGAVAHGRHAYAGLIKTLGPDDQSTGEAAGLLANAMTASHIGPEWPEARALFERRIAVYVFRFGADSEHVFACQRLFLEFLVRVGDYAGSEGLARQMYQSTVRSFSEQSGSRIAAMGKLARAIAWNHGDLVEAEHLARQTLTLRSERRDEFGVGLRSCLADVLQICGHTAEALRVADATLHDLSPTMADDHGALWSPHPRIWSYLHGVRAQCLAGAGCDQDATLAFDEAWGWLVVNGGTQRAINVVMMRRAVEFFERIGDEDRAARWRAALRATALEEGEFGTKKVLAPS